MDTVNVKNLGVIAETIRSLAQIKRDTEDQCAEGLRIVQQVLSESEDELNTSNNILNVCKAVETAKLAKKLETEARMAKALADEAAAIASGNPVAIVAATAEVAALAPELAQAIEEYNNAVEHRQRIEHRCELAQKCVNIAQEMCETLNMRFGFSKGKISERILVGSERLQLAYEDLSRYLSRISPEAKKKYWNGIAGNRKRMSRLSRMRYAIGLMQARMLQMGYLNIFMQLIWILGQ